MNGDVPIVVKFRWFYPPGSVAPPPPDVDAFLAAPEADEPTIVIQPGEMSELPCFTCPVCLIWTERLAKKKIQMVRNVDGWKFLGKCPICGWLLLPCKDADYQRCKAMFAAEIASEPEIVYNPLTPRR